EDVRRRLKSLERLVTALRPLVLREVVPDLDTPAPPGRWTKSRRLDHQLSLPLGRAFKLAPIDHGEPSDLKTGNLGVRRERPGIHHPAHRKNAPQKLVSFSSQLLQPKGTKRSVMQQGHQELLFKVGLERWGHLDQLFADRVQDQVDLGDVFEVKELEKPVKDVDAGRLSFD